MTDRYAVIGNPVGHSLSPRIHAHFATATGEGLTYGTLPADAFGVAAEGFFEAGGRGLNVTLPFKLDAFEWVAERGTVHGAARAAGAVNTIAVSREGAHGYNTDGVGLLRDLEHNLGVGISGRRVLVLGAGGAVQGVLGPLLDAGPHRLTVANRTVSKAERLAAAFAGVEASGLPDLDTDYDVIINGTSAGVAGGRPPIEAAGVQDAFCYDMFYTLEGETPFCRWCAECGAARTADGLGMLIEQAAESFFLWRGVRPPTRGLAQSLRA
ncbi:MAG: shikimate dehydrogenase [Gammaproteobacteria bacterium]|nr:shikimate dehydrogenase [Gammaproteobacteria bacterium]